jgi:hypothetical protein
LPYTSLVDAIENRAVLLVGLLEYDLGASDVGGDGPHRALDDQLDADRGGEVVDDVGLVDQLSDNPGGVARVDRVLELGLRAQVPDVVD